MALNYTYSLANSFLLFVALFCVDVWCCVIFRGGGLVWFGVEWGGVGDIGYK